MATTPVKPSDDAGDNPTTISGRPIKAVYGPDDLADFDPGLRKNRFFQEWIFSKSDIGFELRRRVDLVKT